MATGSGRNKTALAPGHGLNDWIRLLKAQTRQGKARPITLKELAEHAVSVFVFALKFQGPRWGYLDGAWGKGV